MRKSLIRLLKDKLCRKDNNCGYCQYHTGDMCEIDKLADAILKDNWVKLPCDLGGEVFVLGQPCGGCPEYNEPVTEESIEKCRQCKKWEIGTCKFDYELIEDWGKLVFATREEAEERLKELRG